MDEIDIWAVSGATRFSPCFVTAVWVLGDRVVGNALKREANRP